jgi:hypothetical protein
MGGTERSSMSRVRPALAVLLLVLASVVATLAVGGAVSAPVQPGDDPVVATSENSTRVLLLTEADAAQFEQPGMSVTNTLDAGQSGLAVEFAANRFEQRLQATDSEEARQRILRNATDHITERVETLRTMEAQARAAYAEGEISAERYVLTLGTVHEQATQLRGVLNGSQSPNIFRYSDSQEIRVEVRELEAELAAFHGPVRQRVASVMRGARDSLRLHVTVGNGASLAIVEDGEYIRETYRADNWNPAAQGPIDLDNAIDNARDLYPWAANNTVRRFNVPIYGQTANGIIIDHSHGTVVSYVDATSDRVYSERQFLTLSQLPATVEQSDTANNTTLRTSRTYTGGPLLVSVANATGAPTDSTIRLDGRVVGETGEDGRLWVLSPSGTYNVTTTRNGEALGVNVTARPAP